MTQKKVVDYLSPKEEYMTWQKKRAFSPFSRHIFQVWLPFLCLMFLQKTP